MRHVTDSIRANRVNLHLVWKAEVHCLARERGVEPLERIDRDRLVSVGGVQRVSRRALVFDEVDQVPSLTNPSLKPEYKELLFPASATALPQVLTFVIA